MKVAVSILIASRGRPGSLQRSVRSVFGLEGGSDQIELVLVSSACAVTTDVARTLQREAPDWLNVVVMQVSEAGKSLAVNVGLNRCRGDLIALSDDDVSFESDYLRQMLLAFAQTDADAIQGGVRVVLDGPTPRWWTPTCSGILADTSSYAPPIDFLNSCNVAFRRRCLSLTDWPLKFGPGSSGYPIGADIVWSYWLRQRGCRFAFWPELAVLHHIPMSRARLAQLLLRNFRNGRLSALLSDPSRSRAWQQVQAIALASWQIMKWPWSGWSRHRTDSALQLARRIGFVWQYYRPRWLLGELRQSQLQTPCAAKVDQWEAGQ